MIGPMTLLRNLEARGVQLRASGPPPRRLHVTYNNAGDISEKEGTLIKRYRADIVRLLSCRASQEFLSSITNKIVHDDCLNTLRRIHDNSVDVVATDQPYELGFMGKSWDKAMPGVKIWREILRVLKPGGLCFVMSGPRQDCLFKAIGTLIEAGFDVSNSSFYWAYASGFPKIHNIAKAVRKKTGQHKESLQGAYAGFQPKPAIEVILVAIKPISEKSYPEQAMVNGKGCTYMDAGRIPYATEEAPPSRDLRKQKSSAGGQVPASEGDEWNGHQKGRFPANLLVSDDVLDDGKNHKGGGVGGRAKHGRGNGYGFKPQGEDVPVIPKDEGSFSRFFSLDAWAQCNLPFLIVPKASNAEKNVGLKGFDKKTVDDGRAIPCDNPFQRGATPRENTHTTIKPVKLFAYLISLGSRPGDIVLDPFVGSGTTCIAAKLLGRKFIGIEKEKEYHRIAVARVENASLEVPVLRKAVADIKRHEEHDDLKKT